MPGGRSARLKPFVLKFLYKICGLFFVGMGFLGAFLPVLPTTPFLLLALWFFTRSSPRLKEWLLTNKLFGAYISDFYNGKGIPARVKYYTVILLWAVILSSAYAVSGKLWLQIVLIAIACGVTIHILKFKTKRKDGPETDNYSDPDRA